MSAQMPFTLTTMDAETQKAFLKQMRVWLWGILGLAFLALLIAFSLELAVHLALGYRYDAAIRPDSQGLYRYNVRSGETFYCSAEMQDGKLVTGHCEPLPEKGAGKSQ